MEPSCHSTGEPRRQQQQQQQQQHEHERLRLVWHRKGDLRLHDNELYRVENNDNRTTRTVSLFVLDPASYTPRPVASSPSARQGVSSGSSTTGTTNNDYNWWTVTEGPHASRALIGALTDLRKNLQALGGDLIIRRGNPLHVVPALVEEFHVDELWWNEGLPGSYEQEQSDALKQALLRCKTSSFLRVTTIASYSLYHPDDLPRDEETWSRLARPKEKRSKRKQRNTNICTPEYKSASNNNSSNVTFESVDCSARRWTGLPRIMGDFRRAARTHTKVRPCFPPPSKDQIHPFPLIYQNPHHSDEGDGEEEETATVTTVESGDLPDLDELTKPYRGVSLFGLPPATIDIIIQKACTQQQVHTSGETATRAAWDDFLSHHAEVADRSLADTSNYQSAHISTALAMGTLSPRHIYWCVCDYQKKKQQEEDAPLVNDETKPKDQHPPCEWLKSHMEMRDHFLFSALASYLHLFKLNGQNPVHRSKQRGKKQQDKKIDNSERDASGGDMTWRTPLEYSELFHAWAMGQTGLPLIDAGMNEMITTGYCSNRVRQNMASVLSKNLLIDWRIGAEWFQFCLEDHCVGANWGNWQYFGGVGGDPKNRIFRTISQALRYDLTGSYVKKWLPGDTFLVLRGKEGAELNEDIWFRPWAFIDDWNTVVDPSTQYTWQDQQTLEETGCLTQKIW